MTYKIFLLLIGFICLPLTAWAGGSTGFVPLVGIPGLEGDLSFQSYVNALYGLAISLAALIAVIKIVIAGAKYMTSDLVPTHSEAKSDIYNALIGLLIIVGAVIILDTINSNLTNFELDIEPVEITIDNTPINQMITDVEGIIDEAIQEDSVAFTFSCIDLIETSSSSDQVSGQFEYYTGDEDDLEALCQDICENTLKGMYTDYWFADGNDIGTCTYIQERADRCNPETDQVCCNYVYKATWDNTSSTCNGLTEAKELKINSCYTQDDDDGDQINGYWDYESNTCRSSSCDRNSDQKCCEITYGGTFSNNTCDIPTPDPDDYIVPII